MALILKRFMSDTDAEWTVTAFNVVLTGSVFAFLAVMILPS
jgi:hypothetical protein